MSHFNHNKDDTNTEWYTFESEKQPLEGRVWYNYPGQIGDALGAGESGTYDEPVAISRVLDNGQTQLTQIAYNAFGNPTQYIDPAGRTTTLTYGTNQIDVDAIAQTTANGPQTVARFTYNDQHRPLTYTDAAGQTTHYAYNSAGQLTSLTNALVQTTRCEYDAAGDLVQVINADGKIAASFHTGPATMMSRATPMPAAGTSNTTMTPPIGSSGRPIRTARPTNTPTTSWTSSPTRTGKAM